MRDVWSILQWTCKYVYQLSYHDIQCKTKNVYPVPHVYIGGNNWCNIGFGVS